MHGSSRPGEDRMTDRIQIEQAGPAHLAEVIALAQATEDGPRWPLDAWKNYVEPSMFAGERRRVLLVARATDGETIGWLAGSGIYETAELEFVLVHPRRRGRGAGRHLMEYWLSWVKDRGALEALLEVRPSNEAAVWMYHQLGFLERGRRPAYYPEPREDAILMWLDLRQAR